jgi:hypothetical protein
MTTVPAPRLGDPAVVILLAVLLLGACDAPTAVPTYEVVRRDFSHRVIAEGFLRSRRVTQLTVPTEVEYGGRILWMADDGSQVDQDQVVMRLDHYALEQRLEREVAELESADVERGRTAVEGRSSVETATTRKDVASLELRHAERFRRSDDGVFSRREITDSEIEAELARTRRGHAAELEGIESDRTRAQVDLVDIKRRLASVEVDLARAALASLELRAPDRGILMWSRDWRGETPQIGEQVFSGQVMGEIPDFAAIEAEVFVLEADAGGVAVGKPAEITLEAHPERPYAARAVRVDLVPKRRFRGSPVQYLGVTLALETTDLGIMKPGQRVTAAILLGEEPNGLVLPRQALFVEEGSYFVYLARGTGFVRQPVDVRTIAPGLALLAGGLEPGDVVALEEPAATVARAGTRRAGAAWWARG